MNLHTYDEFNNIASKLSQKNQDILYRTLTNLEHTKGYKLKEIDIKNGIAETLLDFDLTKIDLIKLIYLTEHIKLNQKNHTQHFNEIETALKKILISSQEIKIPTSNYLVIKDRLNKMFKNNSRGDCLYKICNAFNITEYDLRNASLYFSEKKHDKKWLYDTLSDIDKVVIYQLAEDLLHYTPHPFFYLITDTSDNIGIE